MYAGWPAKARATVGYLRQAAGRWPDDPELAALVGKLTHQKHRVRHPLGPSRLATAIIWLSSDTEGKVTSWR
ncbi:hypothetical protein ABZW11_31255 [Nonomuraea sp. NPDC004580]|uniref:MmyB family transcriptional regulator n=1 Tax=Nonomuraea sp. NPDC004580 TaxID=3154552 RepID=UPI0033B95732